MPFRQGHKSAPIEARRISDDLRCSGGADALLDQSGVDATSAFEDVGHSEDARKLLNDFKIGRAEKMVRAGYPFIRIRFAGRVGKSAELWQGNTQEGARQCQSYNSSQFKKQHKSEEQGLISSSRKMLECRVENSCSWNGKVQVGGRRYWSRLWSFSLGLHMSLDHEKNAIIGA